MITNDYIYSRCKEKLVRPTISISEISLGNGSNHSRPYGQIYLPTPIIDFPAGSNFEVCVRERETLHNGIPFKFYLPEDFDITNANVVGLVSGSKYFEDTLTLFGSGITQISANYYKSSAGLLFWRSLDLEDDWKTYNIREKLGMGNTRMYFRIEIYKDGQSSAWSQIGSFTYKVRFAESGVEGYKEDGTLITDEDGYVYDGTFYY